MANLTLHPDPKALHQLMLTTGVMAIAICAVVTLFFSRFVSLSPRATMTVVALTWVMFPLLWAVASIAMTKKWRKTSYVFAEDYLIINKSLPFGGKKQRLYRYEAMISLRSEQSYWSKRRGYGTIHIIMPRPEHEVVLSYVSDPERQAVFLKNQITRTRPHPHIEAV